MLRTLFVAGIALYGLSNAIRGPFYSLLFYLWFAYFRPDFWVWDPALVQALNLSWVMGLVLVGSALLSKTVWRFDLRALFLFLFILLDTISAFASPHSAYVLPHYQDFVKTVIVTYLIYVLVDDRRKFRTVLLVIALSLAFEAAKQGWAQLIISPGSKNANGVAVLGDENETAVGMFMLVPILGALASTALTRWERYFHRFLAAGVIYRAIATYSRGGLLTALAVTAVYFVRSPNKIRSLVTVVILGAFIVPVLPQAFWDRMSTMTVSEDRRNEVSEGRLHFWGVAFDMAADRPLVGVGHGGFNASYHDYDTSAGAFGENRSVHSSWFGVLAELGYPGLLLFLANLALAWAACVKVRRLAKGREDLREFWLFASALETALVAFAVGGTFVIFQYKEMLWHFIAVTGALNAIAFRAASSTVEVPRRAAPAPAATSPRAASSSVR